MTERSPRRASRIAQIKTDLRDIEEQLATGELDETTATTLRSRYTTELASVEIADDRRDTEASTRSSENSRRIVGTVLLLGTLTVVGILAVAALQPRGETGLITGDVGGVDLEEVTNDQMEAVIAANSALPQVAAMSVALADRYFDESDFPAALPHYLEALNGQLDSGRRARSLARIGWMTFVSGVPDVAENYLQLALDADASYDEAHLFLGLLHLEGCDPDAARSELAPLLAIDDVPDDIRVDIEVAIGRADELAQSGECT
jgi:tetratricopeptide (TPR) repeat protein